MVLSICALSAVAYACPNCTKGSKSVNAYGQIYGQGVNLRPHRSSDDIYSPSGGTASTGDNGKVTHLYPAYSYDGFEYMGFEWARIEMHSGDCEGLNGWVYCDHITVTRP